MSIKNGSPADRVLGVLQYLAIWVAWLVLLWVPVKVHAADQSVANLSPEQVDALQALAREAIVTCHKQGANSPFAMLDCSGYLVTNDDLARCTSNDLQAVCLVPRYCDLGKTPAAPETCIKGAAKKVLVSASKVRFKALSATEVQRAITSVPVNVPGIGRVKALVACRNKYVKDSDEWNDCSKLLLTPALKKLADCVRRVGNDEVRRVLECPPPGIKAVKLSEGELAVLACGMKKARNESTQDCLDHLGTNEIPRVYLQTMLECTPGEPPVAELTQCLFASYLNSRAVHAARDISDCMQSLVSNAQPKAKNLNASNLKNECLQKIGVPIHDLEKTKDDVVKAKRCADDAVSTGVAGLAPCLPAATRELLTKEQEKIDCLNSKGATGAVGCMGGEMGELQDCYDAAKNNPAALVDCSAAKRKVDPYTQAIAKCSANVAYGPPDKVKDAFAACGALDPELSKLYTSANRAKTRLEAVKAQYEACKQRYDDNSSSAYQDRTAFAVCIAQSQGKSLPPLMSCALHIGAMNMTALTGACGPQLLSTVPGADQALRVYSCYADQNGMSGPTSGIACASVALLGAKAGPLLCLAKLSNQERAICFASKYLPAGIAKIGTCVASAPTPTGVGGCAAKELMPNFFKGLNPEWQAAAECAATSGGEPATTGTCVGTRLVIMELTKCITNGIGTDNGCFGKNNTIVRFLTASWRAVTKPSWGRNNDIRRTLRQYDATFQRPVVEGLGHFLEETRKVIERLVKW